MNAAGLRRHAIAGITRQLLGEFPAPIREAFDTVEIRIKDAIDDEDLARGAAGDLRGYYWGEEDDSEGCEDRLVPLPGCAPIPQIVVLAANVEPSADAVAAVLLHELGHHLGFSEWELVEGLGLI